MKSGIAFHVHHDQLVEWCRDYDERVTFIKNSKPIAEQDLRLKLFTLIPKNRLPAEVGKAEAEISKARAEVVKVGKVVKAGDEFGKVVKVVKARVEFVKAGIEVGKALQRHMPFLEELHSELCPDCPWDGKTIFTEEAAK